MRKLWMQILWLAILLALIAVMGSLLISGDILVFLSPRMVPMVWFGFAVLILLLVYHIVQVIRYTLQKTEIHGGRPGMILFLLPVLLFVTVMPDQSTSGALPNQNLKMMNITQEASADTADEQVSANTNTGEYLPCIVENETALFDTSADLFTDYLYKTLDEVLGKTITLYGFVYAEDTFPANTVLVSRKMITCCAADAAIVGFYVQLEDSAALQDNEWIRVTGTVRSINLAYYNDYYDFPIITNGIGVRCDTPEVDKAYIYP